MQKYDAIVIGAGHNGLTNAAYLARAGRRVLVVEKNPYIGGATVSRELHPGWTYSNCSYVCSLFRPEIYRDLQLARHGLQVIPYEGGLTFMRNGDYFGNFADHERHHREMARHSPRDADAYDRYAADVSRQTRLIRPLLLRTPADPVSLRPRDVFELVYLLKKFRGLGERALHDTMRFWTMSIGDFLAGYFESEVIKAHYAGSGIIGTGLGVYSPGTAYVLLHHYMGDVDGTIGAWGFARGGMGAISGALAAALRGSGGEIRTGAGVHRLKVREGRVTGVALDNGDEIDADIVVSSLDPRRTFLGIIEERDLPPDVVRRARNFRTRGSSGKLNIALDRMPVFRGIAPGHPLLLADLHFIDSLERMERAYDDWKAGTWSRDPYLDVLIPSQLDPTMAPPGKHMMTVFVQYCPPRLADGDWTDAARDGFARTCIDQIAEYSPGFRDLIVHMEVRTPRELEAEVGLTEGNIFHGELTLDQLLFNRPFPGYAQYRGPVRGLYLCGSGHAPGRWRDGGAGRERRARNPARSAPPGRVPEGSDDD